MLSSFWFCSTEANRLLRICPTLVSHVLPFAEETAPLLSASVFSMRLSLAASAPPTGQVCKRVGGLTVLGLCTLWHFLRVSTS